MRSFWRPSQRRPRRAISLTQLPASDVRVVTDGGGKVRASQTVIDGADRAARFLVDATRKRHGAWWRKGLRDAVCSHQRPTGCHRGRIREVGADCGIRDRGRRDSSAIRGAQSGQVGALGEGEGAVGAGSRMSVFARVAASRAVRSMARLPCCYSAATLLTVIGGRDRLWRMARRSREMTLAAFLEDLARPSGTLRYHELQGFLFTVANAPELVMPSDWLPIVFSEGEAGYENLEEAKVILGQMMALYNEINSQVRVEPAELPADCQFRPDTLANFDDDAPIAQWSRGFRIGHNWLEDLWEAYLPKDLDQEHAATLMTLSFFSSSELAEAFLAESGDPDRSLAKLAETMRRLFPDAVAEYAQIGQSIFKVVAEGKVRDRQPRRTVKIGRNEPCPCGSGRKYKVCCAGKVH